MQVDDKMVQNLEKYMYRRNSYTLRDLPWVEELCNQFSELVRNG